MRRSTKWFFRNLESMLCAILAACVISLLVWSAIRTWKAVEHNARCTTYIVRATRAMTPEEALPDLDRAIGYMRDHGQDHGSTSIFAESPDDDLGVWYTHLVRARVALAAMPATANTADRLLTMESFRHAIAEPDGISINGMNRLFFWWPMSSLICLILTIVFVVVGEQWAYDKRREALIAT